LNETIIRGRIPYTEMKQKEWAIKKKKKQDIHGNEWMSLGERKKNNIFVTHKNKIKRMSS
jgi:hypothetical protein